MLQRYLSTHESRPGGDIPSPSRVEVALLFVELTPCCIERVRAEQGPPVDGLAAGSAGAGTPWPRLTIKAAGAGKVWTLAAARGTPGQPASLCDTA